MHISTQYPYSTISANLDWLQEDMISPLTGILQELGILSRERDDPRVCVTGGELTGVHTVLDRPYPGRNAYHVGGCDYLPEKALIKSYAEAIERYCQMLGYQSLNIETCFKSYRQMRNEGRHTISLEQLKPYSSQQYENPTFPFDPYTDQPLTWVRTRSLTKRNELWVPAQHFFVGYNIRTNDNEPWLTTAVTTGTAAHTCPYSAVENALLELIQIDTTIGHWYTDYPCYKIQFDQRTEWLERYLTDTLQNKTPCEFYSIPNPDFGVFTVACLFNPNQNQIPNVAIGLGADHTLAGAMLKAYLEAYGVYNLAKILIFRKKYNKEERLIKNDDFYDLDSNVAYYAEGHCKERIEKKFYQQPSIPASDLPEDCLLTDPKDRVKQLIKTFRDKNIELSMMDITTKEAGQLGFVVPRCYSPDLLSLCFPSSPQKTHARFSQYGGVSHVDPHPYP